MPSLTLTGNSAAPPQLSASAAGPTVTASEDHPDAVSLFASQRDVDLGEGDGSESDDRSLRPEDSFSQAGSPISPARESVEELSYGDAVQSLSKIHPVPDIVGSLAIKPAPKPDSSRAVLQEQASTSSKGLVSLRTRSILEAVIQ